jgi:hypothetical protein
MQESVAKATAQSEFVLVRVRSSPQTRAACDAFTTPSAISGAQRRGEPGDHRIKRAERSRRKVLNKPQDAAANREVISYTLF